MNARAATPSRPIIDVSNLPTYGFGHRSLLWWGMACMMAIEGAVFVVAVVTYFYLRARVPEWPPDALVPGLTWGTLNTAILLVSAVPNQWVKVAADEQRPVATRVGLVVMTAFAVAFIIVRVYEFRALQIRWDRNAYGSIVWTLLGFHTAHLVTDFVDTLVLTVIVLLYPLHGRRYVDVSENCAYWYFVVLTWLPIYAVLYLAPRIL